MSTAIQCACNLSENLRWNCQWATLAADVKVDRRITFSLEPPQFVRVVHYLEHILGQDAEAAPRPDLGAVQLRLRYRHNAKLYELQILGEDGGLKAMVDEPQLTRILAYHRSCLQAYAIAIYEGRVPVPQGYPEGYPEPRWG